MYTCKTLTPPWLVRSAWVDFRLIACVIQPAFEDIIFPAAIHVSFRSHKQPQARRVAPIPRRLRLGPLTAKLASAVRADWQNSELWENLVPVLSPLAGICSRFLTAGFSREQPIP